MGSATASNVVQGQYLKSQSSCANWGVTSINTELYFFQTNALSLQNSKIFFANPSNWTHSDQDIADFEQQTTVVFENSQSSVSIGLTLRTAKNVIWEIYLRSRLRL